MGNETPNGVHYERVINLDSVTNNSFSSNVGTSNYYNQVYISNIPDNQVNGTSILNNLANGYDGSSS